MAARPNTERAILKALARSAPLHVMELTDRTEAHPIVVDQACASLHDDGCLRARAQGIYDITDRGRTRLAGSSTKTNETPPGD